MAKNNAKNTVTETSTRNSLAELAKIKARKEALRQQLADEAKLEAELTNTVKAETEEELAKLPGMFSLPDLESVYKLIGQTLRSRETGQSKRSKFADTEVARAIELYKRGRAADSTPEERIAGNRSAIMKAIGCSGPTLQLWLDKAGLVNKRTVTA